MRMFFSSYVQIKCAKWLTYFNERIAVIIQLSGKFSEIQLLVCILNFCQYFSLKPNLPFSDWPTSLLKLMY